MKLSLSTAELLAQLQTATRVASTRASVQALSGVMLSAEPERALLLATDMEMGIRVPLLAEVESPGSAVLPARLFLDVVRSLPGEQVTLELQSQQQTVEVISGSATFHLRTLRGEDFPTLPEPTGDTRIGLPTKEFVDTALQVLRSASKDETRPVLTGVLITAAEQELTMVATDSYRLSVKHTRIEPPLSGAIEANVPARALQELARIAQTVEQPDLGVSLGHSQVIFEIGEIVLSSRLIDGQFPNYRQLLPANVEYELRLDSAEIVDVVRRVSLLAQKNAPLRLAFAEGELTVSAQTLDIGEANESLPAPFTGDPLEIGFNPEFLRDGLESVESGELVLKLISPLRPGLVESPDGADFVYLIMPIRLNA